MVLYSEGYNIIHGGYIMTNQVTENQVKESFLTLKVMENEDFALLIKSFVKAGKAAQEQSLIASKHALLHFHRTGDTTYMTRLYKAMPESMRKGALKLWLVRHAPVEFSTKLDEFVKDRESNIPTYPAHDKRDNPENAEIITAVNTLINEAWAKPYYEYSKEVDPVVPEAEVFLKKNLENLVKRFDRLSENLKKEGRAVPADITEKMLIVRNLARDMGTEEIAQAA